MWYVGRRSVILSSRSPRSVSSIQVIDKFVIALDSIDFTQVVFISVMFCVVLQRTVLVDPISFSATVDAAFLVRIVAIAITTVAICRTNRLPVVSFCSCDDRFVYN